jgi:acyl-coenzyme A thioesterase PaaI-like protein
MSFFRTITSAWRFRLFLWWKLPAAAFMGVRVAQCDAQRAVVRLPYGWRSQNPFRSIYFAAQCAAGEMSTGILALAALQKHKQVSMLVVHLEAEFLKKAADTLLFTCDQGQALEETIQKAVETGAAQTIRVASTGTLPDGTVAARVWITWSFKKR